MLKFIFKRKYFVSKKVFILKIIKATYLPNIKYLTNGNFLLLLAKKKKDYKFFHFLKRNHLLGL